MEEWKREIVALLEDAKEQAEGDKQQTDYHAARGEGYGGSAVWAERALDDLIRERWEEIFGILSKQGKDVALFRSWLTDLREQDAMMKREGFLMPYDHDGIVPALVVAAIKEDTGGNPVGDLVTANAAAEILAITVKHLRTLTQSGDIPSVKLGERAIRYDEQALQDFIRGGGLS